MDKQKMIAVRRMIVAIDNDMKSAMNGNYDLLPELWQIIREFAVILEFTCDEFRRFHAGTSASYAMIAVDSRFVILVNFEIDDAPLELNEGQGLMVKLSTPTGDFAYWKPNYEIIPLTGAISIGLILLN